MGRARLFLGIFLSTCLLRAQETRVVPWSLEKAEGNRTSVFPFGYTAGRTQQVVDGACLCAHAALIAGMAVRRDGKGSNTYKARRIPSLEIRLGYTRVGPSSMSVNFAANRTGPIVTVFPKTAFDLPPLLPSHPGRFLVRWSWGVPFTYARNRGNLLVEIVIPGVPGHSGYLMDAHACRSMAGKVTFFGKGGTLAGKDPFLVGCPFPARLVPGGSLTLETSGLKRAYAAGVLVGTSRDFLGNLPLPLDLGPLGAPGNFLYVRPTFFFLLPLSISGGSFGGRLSLSLPSSAGMAGARLFSQFFFADKASNSLGLVFSRGLELNLGLPSPPLQLLTSPDVKSPTGALNKALPTGLVLQFTGVFD